MNAARRLAEKAYFQLCLTAGRLLRSGRYSRIRIVDSDGERCGWKYQELEVLYQIGIRIHDAGRR